MGVAVALAALRAIKIYIGEVHILAVVHTSRRWPEQLQKTEKQA